MLYVGEIGHWLFRLSLASLYFCFVSLPVFAAIQYPAGSYDIELVETRSLNHREAIRLAWSPDGKLLAATGPLSPRSTVFSAASFSIGVWGVESGDLLNVIRRNPGGLRPLAFTEDGRHILFTGSQDPARPETTSLSRLNIQNQSEAQLHILSPYAPGLERAELANSAIELSMSDDGAYFAVIYNGNPERRNPVGIYDTKTWSLIRQVDSDGTFIVTGMKFSPDGRRIAIGSYSGDIRIVDIRTGNVELSFHAHNLGVQSLAYSRDGRYLASGARLYNLRPSAPTSPSSGAENDHLKIWDTASGNLAQSFVVGPGVVDISWSQNGRFIAAASGDATRLWDVARPNTVTTIKKFPVQALQVAFNRQDERLAVSGDNGIFVFRIIRK